MGTKTLLNGVNDVLKRFGVIKGNSGELTSLSDPQRQVLIDLAIQCWNETIIDLYDSSEMQFPNEMGIATITLAAGDRDYAPPSDLITLRFPLKNESNGNLIEEYDGGYAGIFRDQLIPANYTGKPYYAAIRPSDGYIYLDRIPQADDAGAVYTYLYDKSLLLSTASQLFPFSDDIYHSLISAVAEKTKMDRDEQSDARYGVSLSKYKKSISLAAGMLRMVPPSTSYGINRYHGQSSDPLED